MLSIAIFGYWVRCSIKGDSLYFNFFAKMTLDGSVMKNKSTETHLTKSKVGLLTPRHLFGPY